MNRLYYDGFDYRKESLEGPNPQTFEWIFDAAGKLILPEENAYDWRTREERRAVWPSFPHWLENSDSSSQYCILGNAGSGKSTLMAWISRDQQGQTVSHLRKWAGSRPVYVVTHFLFRPSVNALGRNLEGLLRSLLFQILSILPELPTSMFDGRGPQSRNSRAIKWPTRVLKEMLKYALHSNQQRVFCIFIDGLDEFQNDGYPEDNFNGLIDYLLELQQPAHVKLCFSSRPTVRKLSNMSSVSETTLQLAALNRLDIHTYVSQVIYQCEGLREPDEIVREVCARAGGVFLWAVFAVQEMSKWAETEELVMLRGRLDRMGSQLEEIFAYMLGNIEPAHRKTLAFYVKAMKWSRMQIIKNPPSVALLVASQEDITNWSYKTLAERCELETRRITHWSHGLLEVESAPHERDVPDLDKSLYAWVRRTSQHIEHGARRSPSDTEEPPTDWIVSKLDCHSRKASSFNYRRISWLHRSAFDFFFSPASRIHTRQAYDLLDSYNNSIVTSTLIQGFERLMLVLPHECDNPCFTCLVYSFHEEAEEIIKVAARATFEFGECHDDALDQVLTTVIAWKHCGLHPEPVADYHVAFHEMRLGDWYCPFVDRKPVHDCVEDNCFVRLDLGALRRDRTMEHFSLENDTCSSLCGTLSEAMFWRCCVQEKVYPSYTIQRCATLHKRRAGGVILACILEAMHPYPGCELSADEMRLVAHVRGQLQLWFNRHAPAPDTNASRWMDVWTYAKTIRSAGADHTIVSCLSFSTRGLTPGQDICRSGTTSQDVENDKCSEQWMVAALASIFVNRPRHDLCLQLSQILAPWDICVNISRRDDDSLAVMINVTELARVKNTIFTMGHIDIASLRLMLGDFENGRTASHWISCDIARRMCKHCMEPGEHPEYGRRMLELNEKAFLSFAEDLLQDVHQNPILLAVEKTTLENALCIPLVDNAKREALVKLLPHSYSWYNYQESGHRLSAEETEEVDRAGQAEQARLMALLSD
jgi:hypothetical protein